MAARLPTVRNLVVDGRRMTAPWLASLADRRDAVKLRWRLPP